MSLQNIVLFILLIVGFIVWMVRLRIREDRYIKQKTKDILRPEIKEELEQEKIELERKREKFQKELEKFNERS